MKYSIHISPIEWEGRIYKENEALRAPNDAKEAYDKRLPFEGGMLIRRFGDTMWLSMALSHLDNEERGEWDIVKQMKKMFKKMGIKRVQWDDGKRIQTMHI